MNPRQQGDLGEYSAIEWLASRGYPVFVPIGHSPDVDLVALMDRRAVRVQVKTCRRRVPVNRWDVMLCTRGGNQSWNGLSKRFSSDRCDYLFVLVGDGGGAGSSPRTWLGAVRASLLEASITPATRSTAAGLSLHWPPPRRG